MIPAFEKNQVDDIVNAFNKYGAVVVKGMGVNPQLRKEITEVLNQIEPSVDEGGFFAGHTKRVASIVRRFPSCHQHVAHPATMTILDKILKPNCSDYQFHASGILAIQPGAREQTLHREEDTFFSMQMHDMKNRPTLIVATMLAITDFTKENGATLIVPGSHKWPAVDGKSSSFSPQARKATPEEVVSAEMKAGDMLIWHGLTLHAGGANTTKDVDREGLIMTYSLGWLRTEENFHLSSGTFEQVKTYPKIIRELCGYKMHGGGLGFYDDMRDVMGAKSPGIFGTLIGSNQTTNSKL